MGSISRRGAHGRIFDSPCQRQFGETVFFCILDERPSFLRGKRWSQQQSVRTACTVGKFRAPRVIAQPSGKAMLCGGLPEHEVSDVIRRWGFEGGDREYDHDSHSAEDRAKGRDGSRRLRDRR